MAGIRDVLRETLETASDPQCSPPDRSSLQHLAKHVSDRLPRRESIVSDVEQAGLEVDEKCLDVDWHLLVRIVRNIAHGPAGRRKCAETRLFDGGHLCEANVDLLERQIGKFRRVEDKS